ncbi:MAG: hypothetical protein AUG51_20470 [Acidobacteria bacterium 13_1_20CM_3_53_8]|nr:MAG: hypothetical protein AUG51_20470 [Acidobacteria bacterium 13_1_20CM_3_53_8]
MSEDPTQNMDGSRSFEERVFNELRAINLRLTNLEERVDKRLQETRPIWEAVQEKLERLERKFDRLNEKFDLVTSDLYDMRANYKSLSKRLNDLEDARS